MAQVAVLRKSWDEAAKLVRRIAALHDVSVSLRSTPGRGSRFTLRFRSAAFRPLAPATPATRCASR